MAAAEGLPRLVAEPEGCETAIGGLPTRLRLLCVGSVEPSWVSLTLELDALGCTEPNFRWVSTAGEALALLRDESFDCLLIRSAAPREDDLLSLARGIRAGGCADPIVIVTVAIDDETWAQALRLDVDLLATAKGWESSALVQTIQRAVERGRMLQDIDRLATADRRRLLRERDEADYLLNQQRRILAALEQLAGAPAEEGGAHDPAAGISSGARLGLPAEFDDYYQELLRTYVIMGSGNLATEVVKLAEVLAQAGLAPREVLDLHLSRVEKLVRGLGNRSTRHVMARADLLALELLINLGECYRRSGRPEPGDDALRAAPPVSHEEL